MTTTSTTPATHTTEIHIFERPDSRPDDRCFNGWVVGHKDVFERSAVCAMGSSAIIAWIVEIEKRAWQWSEASKIWRDGTPCLDRIETVRIHENF